MPKKASIISTSEYWIELSPVVVEAYFSFHSSKGEHVLNNKMPLQDFYTLTFEGTVSASWTPKLALRTPVTITLRETDQGGSAGGGFLENRKVTHNVITLPNNMG